MADKPDDIAHQTDVYFRKTKEIVGRFGDREATYAIFLRRPVISTPKLMIDFLEGVAKTRRTKIKIELNCREGQLVGAGEPLAYLTGSLEHLVDLETLYLQKLGPACVAAYNAYEMCRALPRVAFLAMDARHCAGPEMAEMMAYAAAVGSAAAKREGDAIGFIATPRTRPRIISVKRRASARCRMRSSAMPARPCARPRCIAKPIPMSR